MATQKLLQHRLLRSFALHQELFYEETYIIVRTTSTRLPVLRRSYSILEFLQLAHPGFERRRFDHAVHGPA
ncbi:MAG: hypothetical protein A3J94_12540 [Syntrophus sp. RIFOXYC2_FULL_54_9]|nr:MAG: hypothetical protein A3J94_12540 [Syntrophus sp. RIFOXYC2_FULL_54_9]